MGTLGYIEHKAIANMGNRWDLYKRVCVTVHASRGDMNIQSNSCRNTNSLCCSCYDNWLYNALLWHHATCHQFVFLPKSLHRKHKEPTAINTKLIHLLHTSIIPANTMNISLDPKLQHDRISDYKNEQPKPAPSKPNCFSSFSYF